MNELENQIETHLEETGGWKDFIDEEKTDFENTILTSVFAKIAEQKGTITYADITVLYELNEEPGQCESLAKIKVDKKGNIQYVERRK